MNHPFRTFIAACPRITALFGTAYLATCAVRLFLSQRFILDTVVELIGGLFLLITVIAAPFAVVQLWRKYGSTLRQVPVPQVVPSMDWKATVAKGVTSSAGSAATAWAGITKARRAVRRRVRPGIASAGTAAAAVDWPAKTRTLLRVLAGISLIVLQILIALAGITCAVALLPTLQSSPTAYVLQIVGALAWPFAILALVALQTRYGLIRLSNYSPAAMQTFATRLFKTAPVIALISVVGLAVALGPEDWGWMILIAPFLSVQIILYGAVLYGLISIFRMLTTRFQKPPSDPPARHEPPVMPHPATH